MQHATKPPDTGQLRTGTGATTITEQAPGLPAGTAPNPVSPGAPTTNVEPPRAGTTDTSAAGLLTASATDNPVALGGGSWLERVQAGVDRARATRLSQKEAMKSKTLHGVWKPAERAQLLATLMTDWETISESPWSPEVQAMRKLALDPANVCCGESIRAWTESEASTLLAYTRGELDIPHPPNFIKEIMIIEHRALLEDFHEAHLNFSLTANLPPSVRLARNAPHVAILQELFHANTDEAGRGCAMMHRLLHDVKRFSFDGNHTLSLYSTLKRQALFWNKKAFRFQRAVVVLSDTSRRAEDEGTGSFTTAQLQLQYAIRIYGATQLGLAPVARAIGQLAGAKVLDVEYPRSVKTDIYDNRFHHVVFPKAACPEALVDVTRIALNGTPLVVHHYQNHLRQPCPRCYSPRHGIKMCKCPGSHGSFGNATRFFGSKPGNRTGNTREGSLPTSSGIEAGQAPSATPTVAQVSSDPLTAEFTVKQSKSAKRAIKKAASKGGALPSGESTVNASRGLASKQPSGKRRATGKTQKRFEAFQRAEAIGLYGGLESDDSESEDDMDISDSCSDDEEDEASYAYPEAERKNSDVEMDAGTAEAKSETDATLHGAAASVGGTTMSDAAAEAEALAEQAERRREDDQARDLRLKSETALLPEVETAPVGHVVVGPGGLVQSKMDNFVAPPTAIQQHHIAHSASVSMPAAARMPPSPTSDEEFTMGAPHAGTADGDHDLPIQLMLWLKSFKGQPVGVPRTGQCAMLAFHATTSNFDGSKLRRTAKVTRGANKIKRVIYSIMMANLRRDVELGLVNPITELQRLYPDRKTGDGIASATASLFVHYAQEHQRSVSTEVPASFWAGPHELRAMAQYVREPLFVLDVNQRGDAHVQRYMYKDYRMSDGSVHESGYVEALPDRVARDYLCECWELHAMPIMMVLRRNEMHFNGVQHGELLTLWNAEGDSDYADTLDASFDWIADVQQRNADRGELLQDGEVLSRASHVNAAIPRQMPMRSRLDVVLARLGLPSLDKMPVDERILEATMEAEERVIHEACGVDGYASGSQSSQRPAPTVDTLPPREPRIAKGSIVEATYKRILSTVSVADLHDDDHPQYELLCAANQEAFAKWATKYRRQLQIPVMQRKSTSVDAIRSWLLKTHDALRHLFAFIPYPELEAKQWSLHQLLRWGCLEVYREQTAALDRILQESAQPIEAREFREPWKTGCTTAPLTTASLQLAGSGDRWKRLRQWIPMEQCRDNYVELPEEVWRLLHVLPYVISTWDTTPMGRGPHGARVVWHHEYPFVSAICDNILARHDWGLALAAPSGQPWADGEATSSSHPSRSPSY